jgi:hypothetical protein
MEYRVSDSLRQKTSVIEQRESHSLRQKTSVIERTFAPFATLGGAGRKCGFPFHVFASTSSCNDVMM